MRTRKRGITSTDQKATAREEGRGKRTKSLFQLTLQLGEGGVSRWNSLLVDTSQRVKKPKGRFEIFFVHVSFLILSRGWNVISLGMDWRGKIHGDLPDACACFIKWDGEEVENKGTDRKGLPLSL